MWKKCWSSELPFYFNRTDKCICCYEWKFHTCIETNCKRSNVYQWLKENNPNFTNVADSYLFPNLIILEDDTSSDDDPVNPRLENMIDIQYWVINNGSPNSSDPIFCSQSEFIDSLLKAK